MVQACQRPERDSLLVRLAKHQEKKRDKQEDLPVGVKCSEQSFRKLSFS